MYVRDNPGRVVGVYAFGTSPLMASKPAIDRTAKFGFPGSEFSLRNRAASGTLGE
jgi:hypothetical protein